MFWDRHLVKTEQSGNKIAGIVQVPIFQVAQTNAHNYYPSPSFVNAPKSDIKCYALCTVSNPFRN